MSVLVTGAVGAIGSATVDRLLAAGEEVLAQDLDPARLERRPGVTTVAGDLLAASTLDQIAGLAASTGLSAVVAAHGVAGSNALADCSDAFIDRVLTINWASIPRLYDAVAAALLANRGTFVAVSSQAALGGESENIVYCAAKFAVNGWISAQQASVPEVSFHSLCPGPTHSALLMTAQAQFAAAMGLTVEQYAVERAKQIALGRYGEPREMSAAAYYLTRPGPRPTVLPVTGGDVLL